MAKNVSFKTVSLKAFLKDADERVREAAARALNAASAELQQNIKTNMAAQGIRQRSGRLVGSIKATKATAKNPSVKISSEVFAKMPKRPGLRNPRMRSRYKYGVPYGRIIEFSPRINRPFFYTAWYKKRNAIKKEVMEEIGNAWSGR